MPAPQNQSKPTSHKMAPHRSSNNDSMLLAVLGAVIGLIGLFCSGSSKVAVIVLSLIGLAISIFAVYRASVTKTRGSKAVSIVAIVICAIVLFIGLILPSSPDSDNKPAKPATASKVVKKPSKKKNVKKKKSKEDPLVKEFMKEGNSANEATTVLTATVPGKGWLQYGVDGKYQNFDFNKTWTKTIKGAEANKDWQLTVMPDDSAKVDQTFSCDIKMDGQTNSHHEQTLKDTDMNADALDHGSVKCNAFERLGVHDDQ